MIHAYKRIVQKIFFSVLLLLISCVSSNSNQISNDLKLITDYSQNYFVGLGIGKASTENIAMKIARATALGELSTNIKVHMKSKLELYQYESSDGASFESISQQIIEIGQATVRAPEYEIISTNYDQKSKIYQVKIVAKKIKSEYYKETAQSFNLKESDALLKLLID